jgi:hypothetical protein
MIVFWSGRFVNARCNGIQKPYFSSIKERQTVDNICVLEFHSIENAIHTGKSSAETFGTTGTVGIIGTVFRDTLNVCRTRYEAIWFIQFENREE